MKNNYLNNLSFAGLILFTLISGYLFITNEVNSKYYCLLLFMVFLILIYFYEKWNNYLNKYIKNTKEFKGFGKTVVAAETNASYDLFDVNRETNSHVLIIGATHTGKTHFIRNQLMNTNEQVLILCNYEQ